jgi:hypothetical protein
VFASGRGTALDTQNTVIGRLRHSDRIVAITHDREGLFPWPGGTLDRAIHRWHHGWAGASVLVTVPIERQLGGLLDARY